jgi:HSP20 family molecular chaperone IbpA
MAPRAHHLNKVPLNWHKTIDRLFTAAFGPSDVAYQRASLCGWRSLASNAQLDPLLGDHEDGPSRTTENGPGVAILETAIGFTIEIDMPDIKEESLYLEVSGDTLIIRGERAEPTAPPPSPANRRLKHALFQKIIRLPVLAHPGQVRAKLKGDTIRINIAKWK